MRFQIQTIALPISCVVFGVALFFQTSGACVAQNEKTREVEKAETDSQEPDEETELLKAVAASREVYRDEYYPIQKDLNDQSNEISMKVSTEQQFIRELKKEQANQLESVRMQHAQLTRRLRMLERLEETLTDMNPDAKEKAIAKSEETMEKLAKERTKALEPAMQDLSALQRQYSGENQPFANHFTLFFKEMGTGEFKDFKRKYLNSNYVVGQVSSRFQSDDQMITVSMILNNQNIFVPKDAKKMLGKYEIMYQSETNLNVKVGDIYVSVHVQKDPLEKEALQKFLSNVLDLEKVERVLGKTGKKAK